MIKPILQPGLFKYHISDSDCSLHQCEILLKEGLLSFDPKNKEEFEGYEIMELKFLKILYFDSGISSAVVKSMLSKLGKPYSYSLNKIYWDFGTQDWKELPPSIDDYIEENIKDIVFENFDAFIDEVDKEDGYELDELSLISEKIKDYLEGVNKTKKGNKVRRVCPKCGSDAVLRIVYGLPGPELEKRTDIYLGGCCMTGEDPEWHCNKCHWEWGKNFDGRYCEDEEV